MTLRTARRPLPRAAARPALALVARAAAAARVSAATLRTEPGRCGPVVVPAGTSSVVVRPAG